MVLFRAAGQISRAGSGALDEVRALLKDARDTLGPVAADDRGAAGAGSGDPGAWSSRVGG